jgi:hypothetical protein
MKTVKVAIIITVFAFLQNVSAQEAKASTNDSVQTKHSVSYYEERGAQDALYELNFESKTKSEDRAFWNEKQAYEKELKRNNRRAYRSYLQGKRDGYAAHYDHCDSHCHHSDYWYQHADYYYYRYRQPRYEDRSSRTSVNTQIGVSAPRVRLGLF